MNSEIMRAQLTFQIAKPAMDLTGARHSAAQLDERLAPVILDHFAGMPALPRVQLLMPPTTSPFKMWPDAVFRLQPRLGVADLPIGWVPAYLDWAARLKRSQKIATARVRMAEAIRHGIDGNFDITHDPIIAGLLMFEFAPNPDTKLRAGLMKIALAQPLGGYLCAEALNTASEREAIIGAAAGDSFTLLGASHLSEFADACLRLARSRQDLASGLVVARLGNDDEIASWLRETGLAAFQDGAAACAMLVLHPAAPESLQDGWIATLQNPDEHRHAFSTVRWSRHTWASSTWTCLRDALKPNCIRHGQRHWFNWFAQIEPEAAAAGLDMPADSLWAFELVHKLNLDPEELRFQLADQLGRNSYLPEASLVLSALNHRDDLRREGGC
jgi:hypothetical protein